MRVGDDVDYLGTKIKEVRPVTILKEDFEEELALLYLYDGNHDHMTVRELRAMIAAHSEYQDPAYD